MLEGGLPSSVSSLRYILDVVAAATVSTGSKIFQPILILSSWRSVGGIMCVMYPVLSLSNASFLNPTETRDFAPKLELELVIDWSAPSSARKC